MFNTSTHTHTVVIPHVNENDTDILSKLTALCVECVFLHI